MHRVLCDGPWVGFRSFFTPAQADFRRTYNGFFATPQLGAHAKLRLMRKLPTGAATAETLDPDGALWRQVTGSWGRPTRAGHP